MLQEIAANREGRSSKPLRTLIISACLDCDIATKLREIIAGDQGLPVPEIASFEDAELSFARSKPELVAVCLSGNPEDDEDIIRLLRRLQTDGYIIAIGDIQDPKVILRCLQFGADSFVDCDDLEAEFAAAVCRLTQKEETKTRTGRLVAVVAASGGCGVSTLAANLAAVLARERGKCALVDLNPGRGDIAALLDLKPRFTIADLCFNETRLDRAMLEKSLAAHASGIHLLGAPAEFTDDRSVTPGGVRQALSVCRKLFGDTIVDLANCYQSEQVEVLTRATSVVVVCRLDFGSLRNTRRLLRHLDKLDVARDRVKVVVNEHGRPGELALSAAEEALCTKIAVLIPYEPKAILAANNTGVPSVLKDPNTKLANAVAQVAGLQVAKSSGASGFLPKLRIF